VVLPMTEQKKWVFKTTQNDDLIANALVAQMVKTKVKTVGFITINDPFGENWAKVFGELAPRTASRSWPTSATSAPIPRSPRRPSRSRGQSRCGAGSRPGAATVLPQTTLYDQGYKGKIYQTHGAACRPSCSWARTRSRAPFSPPA
jgi:branched-chain amino acid transport system substrate-binding protein